VMEAGAGPVVLNPLKTEEDLNRLRKRTDIDVYRDLGYVFDTITLCRQQLKGRVPIIGFAGGPWTMMVYMVQHQGGGKTNNHVKRWLYERPAATRALMTLITQVTVDYLVGQVQAGAQMLEVFESWAIDLGPEAFAEFCLPYLAAIAKETKQRLRDKGIPPVPITVFPRGAHYALAMLTDTEYDVVSLDHTIPPAWARQQVKNKLSLQGNLEPVVLYASKEVIEANVKRMIDQFGTQRYIANLGWGMLPDHPIQGAAAFIEAVHSYSAHLNQQRQQ